MSFAHFNPPYTNAEFLFCIIGNFECAHVLIHGGVLDARMINPPDGWACSQRGQRRDSPASLFRFIVMSLLSTERAHALSGH